MEIKSSNNKQARRGNWIVVILVCVSISFAGCRHHPKQKPDREANAANELELQYAKYQALVNERSFDTTHLSLHILFTVGESYGQERISFDIRSVDSLSFVELKINVSDMDVIQNPPTRLFSSPKVRAIGQFVPTKEILIYKDFLDKYLSQIGWKKVNQIIDDRPVNVKYFDGRKQYLLIGRTINYQNLDEIDSFIENSPMYRKFKSELLAAFNDKMIH